MATSDVAAETSERKIRYAVVGLGYISQIAILPAFGHATEYSTLTALVSSDQEKLKKLSRKYRVKRTYTYEEYVLCPRQKLASVLTPAWKFPKSPFACHNS